MRKSCSGPEIWNPSFSGSPFWLCSVCLCKTSLSLIMLLFVGHLSVSLKLSSFWQETTEKESSGCFEVLRSWFLVSSWDFLFFEKEQRKKYAICSDINYEYPHQPTPPVCVDASKHQLCGVAGKVGPKCRTLCNEHSAFIYSEVNINAMIDPRVSPTSMPCLLPVSVLRVSLSLGNHRRSH